MFIENVPPMLEFNLRTPAKHERVKYIFFILFSVFFSIGFSQNTHEYACFTVLNTKNDCLVYTPCRLSSNLKVSFKTKTISVIANIKYADFIDKISP
jgi:hypothetical protein